MENYLQEEEYIVRCIFMAQFWYTYTGKMYIPIKVVVLKLSDCVILFCLVHVWAINKDLSVHVTEVFG